jgi:dTDP-4-dehydrorhamnose reductase
MKVFITGGNGFLAQHLAVFLYNKGFEVHCSYRINGQKFTNSTVHYHFLELTNVSSLNKIINTLKADVIIHSAAMSKPDECENDHAACLLNNLTVTKNLIKAAEKISTHFIYISTDFIFGENGPHSETAIPNPLNFYGSSKLLAENAVKSSSLLYTIVRPVFIYGALMQGMRNSFIQWVEQNLQLSKTIKVVNDQYRTPTFVEDICWGIEQIILLKKQGEYHLAGKDICTPYSMAVTVAKVLKLNVQLIEEVNSSNFPEPVIRARKSGLKIDKAIKELNYNPHSFEEGVRKSFNVE